MARVQEAVINVKEGGLPEALEAAIEAINFAVGEVTDKPEADQLRTPSRTIGGALDGGGEGRSRRSPACARAGSMDGQIRPFWNPLPGNESGPTVRRSGTTTPEATKEPQPSGDQSEVPGTSGSKSRPTVKPSDARSLRTTALETGSARNLGRRKAGRCRSLGIVQVDGEHKAGSQLSMLRFWPSFCSCMSKLFSLRCGAFPRT